MNQQEKKDRYLNLYYIKRLNEWDKISKIDQSFDRNKYNVIEEYIADRCDCTYQEIQIFKTELQKEIEGINSIYSRFNNKRTIGFGTFERFYNWYIMQYEKQNGKCHYCETAEDNLKQLFQTGIFKPKKPAWKNGTLQIEKKEPDKGYIPENCVLACVFCNNAKSDLISDDDFKAKFAEPMREYLQEKIINLKK